MANDSENILTIHGSEREIKRFMDGLLRKGKGYRLLQSYFPCPSGLFNTDLSWIDICYAVYFDPNPDAYKDFLDNKKVKKVGIKTRTEMMEFLNEDHPELYDKYDNILKRQNNLAKYGFETWIHWRIANWGTMWEDYNTELIEIKPWCVIFEFFSLWNPPSKAFDYIASLFPQLDFHLISGKTGMDFGMMDFRSYDRWETGEHVGSRLENSDHQYCEEILSQADEVEMASNTEGDYE